MQNVVNLVLFQVVWFATILGAANGSFWPGSVAMSLAMVVHYLLTRTRRADFMMVALATLAGLVIETIFLQSGLLVYARSDLWVQLAPGWVLILWANFALTLNGCLRWLQGRYLLAAMLGAIGGPLSYFGGIRFGAASADVAMPIVLLVIAITYALVTPLFLAGARRLATAE